MAAKFVDESKTILRLSDLTSEPKRMLPPVKGYENQPLVTLENAVEPLISIVPDVEQMVWTVKQNCLQPQDSLTSDESGSIMLYTLEWEPNESSFYFILNSTLRAENRQQLRPWFLFLRLIIFALAKLPTIPSRTFYRGIQCDISKDYLKDRTFIWWAFSSCTSTLEVIEDFLGEKGPRTILNIESNSAKDISRHSFYRTEKEILLYPARQFQVIASLPVGNQFHIIQLKEIQPPFPLIHIPLANSTISITPMIQTHQNQRIKDLIDKCYPRSEAKLPLQQLTDDDMHIVVNEAIINKQCRILWLGNNEITSVGTAIITRALNGNNTLEELNLSDNKVGDMGARFLTKTLALNNSSLRKLFLISTEITDEGAAYLAEMLKTNSTLSHVSLGQNNISDQGMKLLSNALGYHNNTLQSIFLTGNKLVSDLSVDPLVEMLKHNCTLYYLRINDCNLSEKGKKRLRKITKTKDGFTLEV